MSVTKSQDRDNMELGDEKFVEVAKNGNGAGLDGMTDHERTVLTRKILLKLDFRYGLNTFLQYQYID